VGSKACEIDGYKLWYLRCLSTRNKVSVLIDKDLVDGVVEVRRKSDHIMFVKLVVGVDIIKVICIYAPQVGLTDVIKREFWDELEEVI